MKLKDLHFEVPDEKAAPMPAEAAGRSRSDVRLLVIHRASRQIEHRRFVDLPEYLRPGDSVVLNASATLPAQFMATDEQGRAIKVRLSSRDPSANGKGDKWHAVLDPDSEIRPGAVLRFGLLDGLELTASVVTRHPRVHKLWLLVFDLKGITLDRWRERLGRPIRYDYVPQEWSLNYYQNVYAQFPGSSEMPSAGRAFTPQLLARINAQGVGLVRIVLHTGVSNIDIEEEQVEQHRMYEEPYQITDEAAQLINHARERGGRVFAIGTTVVRTLETVADEQGYLEGRRGWTSLYITPGYRFKVVDALVTGLHEAKSTRLVLATAFAGDKALVLQAYHEALEHDYHWHEFGDLSLIV
ncbi:MAG TPA: S-adenosylmethionine:tRNA ribosyltransferase-isomerase [Anaerolineae bacterium]|nr:S-adenosylmethionine:tRNA ribosyltransferase-isomerase [Anaerolineae bacterium]